MDIKQFGQTIKQKYPQYADMDDIQLGQKMLDKYPQYSDMITKSDKSIIGKALEGTANVINNSYDRLTNPKIPFTNISLPTPIGTPLGLAVGAAGGLIGGIAGAEGELANQVYRGLTGKGFNIGEIKNSTIQEAKNTARFGYDIGKSGGDAGALRVLGWLPNLAISYGQGYQGINDIVSGIKSGDENQMLQGALETGTAVVSGVSGIREPFKSGNIKTALKQSLVSPEVAKTVEGLHSSIKMAKIEKIQNDAYNSYYELYNQKKGLIKEDLKKGKDITKFIADEGFIPQQTPDGRIDNTKSIDQLKERRNALDDYYQKELDKLPEQNIKLSDIREKARENWKNEKNISALEREDGYKAIDDYIQAEILINARNMGMDLSRWKGNINKLLLSKAAEVNGSKLNEIKRGMWNSAYAQDRPVVIDKAAHTIGDAAVTELETKYKNVAEINEINKKLGNYSDAMKFLSETNGNVPKGLGYWSKFIARLAGGYVGFVTGGPVGAAAGVKISETSLKNIKNPERVATKIQKKLKSTKIEE